MGDLLLLQELPDPFGLHGAKAHLVATDRRKSPGRAPPIAMEHGKRPQVHGLGAMLGVKQFTEAVQIRATMEYMTPVGLPVVPDV